MRKEKNRSLRVAGLAVALLLSASFLSEAALPVRAAEAMTAEERAQAQAAKEQEKEKAAEKSEAKESAGDTEKIPEEHAEGVGQSAVDGLQKKHAYEILKPLTEEDKARSQEIMNPTGMMSLYRSEKTAEEYLARAKEQDKIFEEYDNIGIANVSDTLNIRKSPEQSGTLVGRLPSNAVCNIESEEGEWSYITSGEVEGYVKSEYLATGKDARKLATNAIQTKATVHVSDGNLTVRTEPNEKGPVLTAVANGEELEVEEALGNWVKINLDNNIAYVNAEYVTVEKSLRTAMTVSELIYGAGVGSIRAEICNYAMQFIGNPYVWGGTSPTKGADCSGFVQTIYATYGVSLPRVAAAQATVGTSVSLAEALPGDLVFYSGGGRIDHVGIYIGNGQIVNAASRRSGICVKAVGYRTITKITRVLPGL